MSENVLDKYGVEIDYVIEQVKTFIKKKLTFSTYAKFTKQDIKSYIEYQTNWKITVLDYYTGLDKVTRMEKFFYKLCKVLTIESAFYGRDDINLYSTAYLKTSFIPRQSKYSVECNFVIDKDCKITVNKHITKIPEKEYFSTIKKDAYTIAKENLNSTFSPQLKTIEPDYWIPTYYMNTDTYYSDTYYSDSYSNYNSHDCGCHDSGCHDSGGGDCGCSDGGGCGCD